MHCLAMQVSIPCCPVPRRELLAMASKARSGGSTAKKTRAQSHTQSINQSSSLSLYIYTHTYIYVCVCARAHDINSIFWLTRSRRDSCVPLFIPRVFPAAPERGGSPRHVHFHLPDVYFCHVTLSREGRGEKKNERGENQNPDGVALYLSTSPPLYVCLFILHQALSEHTGA